MEVCISCSFAARAESSGINPEGVEMMATPALLLCFAAVALEVGASCRLLGEILSRDCQTSVASRSWKSFFSFRPFQTQQAEGKRAKGIGKRSKLRRRRAEGANGKMRGRQEIHALPCPHITYSLSLQIYMFHCIDRVSTKSFTGFVITHQGGAMSANDVGVPAQGRTGDQFVSPAILFQSQLWHKAYMAALFESDATRIGKRISYAEQLIVSRERELFGEASDPVEQRAVVGALHALRALRVCLHL
jgi:hypothetical protein